MDTKQRTELFLFINEHREATDHPTFKELTDAEIDHHMNLIEEHAPHGEDPWGDEPCCQEPKYRGGKCDNCGHWAHLAGPPGVKPN